MNGLENVQVGDTVIYWPADQNAVPQYVSVERVTKTQITAGAQRWLRGDGYAVGARLNIWHHAYIMALTDATKAQAQKAIKERTLAARRHHSVWIIRETQWDRVPLETLEQIAEMLKAAQLEATP
jgi:delta 1-pyrroline-5-carboxylate dehydrogenase